MKRPTKPVMWTDEEAINRAEKWLMDNGWEKYIHPDYDNFVRFKKGSIFFHVKISPRRSHDINQIIEYVVDNTITLTSFLHDLNIIKPIGRLEYTSEWIDKILAGTKTMSIRKTQYMCGFYELWDTQRQEVRGIVEVDQVETMRMDLLFPVSDGISLMIVECLFEECGFNSIQDFVHYHHDNFQSVKYAITYRVVDMKGDGE